jgi:hypothetical protein
MFNKKLYLKMKKSLLLVLFSCVATVGFAQSNGSEERQSRWSGTIDYGYNIGVGKSALNGFSVVNFDIGYLMNRFYVGIGGGMRYFPDIATTFWEFQDGYTFPVFADFQYKFLDSEISPYLSLDVGYSFVDFEFSEKFLANHSNVKPSGGGFMLNPTIGVDIKIKKESSFFIGVGYEMQKLNFNDERVTSKNVGAIVIRIGGAL